MGGRIGAIRSFFFGRAEKEKKKRKTEITSTRGGRKIRREKKKKGAERAMVVPASQLQRRIKKGTPRGKGREKKFCGETLMPSGGKRKRPASGSEEKKRGKRHHPYLH